MLEDVFKVQNQVLSTYGKSEQCIEKWNRVELTKKTSHCIRVVLFLRKRRLKNNLFTRLDSNDNRRRALDLCTLQCFEKLLVMYPIRAERWWIPIAPKSLQALHGAEN